MSTFPELSGDLDVLMKPLATASPSALSVQQELERMKAMLTAGIMQQMISSRSLLGAPSGLLPDAIEKPPSVDVAKLAALKETEPHRVTKPTPDYMEVITAWRAWAVENTPDGINILGSAAGEVYS